MRIGAALGKGQTLPAALLGVLMVLTGCGRDSTPAEKAVADLPAAETPVTDAPGREGPLVPEPEPELAAGRLVNTDFPEESRNAEMPATIPATEAPQAEVVADDPTLNVGSAESPMSMDELEESWSRLSQKRPIVVRGTIWSVDPHESAFAGNDKRRFSVRLINSQLFVDESGLGSGPAFNFEHPTDISGLVPEQEVVLEGQVVDAGGRRQFATGAVKVLRIVSQGAPPADAPQPLPVLSDTEWAAGQELCRSRSTNSAVSFGIDTTDGHTSGVVQFQYDFTSVTSSALDNQGRIPSDLYRKLVAQPFVECLMFSGASTNAALLKQLSQLKSLRRLSLSDLEEEGQKGADLTPLKSLPHLLSLHLTADESIHDAQLAQIASWPCLRELEVVGGENCPLTGQGLSQLAQRKTLRRLTIADGDTGFQGIYPLQFDDAAIASLGRLPLLCEFTLRSDHVDGSGVAAFGECPQLYSLEIVGKQLTDEGLNRGADRDWPSLVRLKIDAPRVTDAGLVRLVGQTGHALKRLELHCPQMTDATLQSLASAGPRRLTRLVCTDCVRISDPGLIALVKSHPPQLRHLLLSGTSLTDKGAATLAQLKSLREVVLPSTVSAEAVRQLKQDLPQTVIISAKGR